MTLRGSATTRIDASTDDVFRVATDIDELPEWNAAITRVVEPLTELVPGCEWVVEVRAMGNTWRSRSRVSDYDSASRRFSYTSRTDDGNSSDGDWTWHVVADGDGCRVTVTWELHPRTFWRRTLLARIRHRQLHREVRSSLQAIEPLLARRRERR